MTSAPEPVHSSRLANPQFHAGSLSSDEEGYARESIIHPVLNGELGDALRWMLATAGYSNWYYRARMSPSH